MSVIQGNAKQGSVRGFYPKTIEGSLRFNDDDSAYLSWTAGTPTNNKIWTFSCWFKRTEVGDDLYFLTAGSSTANRTLITLDANDVLFIRESISSTDYSLRSSMVFRDPSAWYHLVVAVDTTQSTSSNRIKCYINGEQITSFGTEQYPPQNTNTQINSAIEHNLGKATWTADYMDGYLAEVHFTDGTAYDADAFGELKNGVWVAKTPDVTYGTNGFYLDFQDDTEVEAFNTVLYRGNGLSSSSVTGMGFEPDLVWIKARDGAYNHLLFDSVRGVGKYLPSSESYAENWAGNLFPNSEPTTDGFIVDGHLNVSINESGKKYVGWGWKAGGAPTVDNSAGAGNVPTPGSVKVDGVNSTSTLAGSLPATRISASTTYGFSIVSYSGSGGNATIAHELGVAPSMIMFKNRTTDRYWLVHHKDIPLGSSSELQYVILDQPQAAEGMGAVNPFMQGTLPTSTEFYVHNNLGYNSSSNNYIAYCWAETAGYSKFDSFAGEGSNNTTISKRIYTTNDGTASGTGGFRPSMIIFKRTDINSVNGWYMFDSTRDTDSVVGHPLFPDQTYTEGGTESVIEFNDDGFTIVRAYQDYCGAGGTYIYAAFADTREAAFWLDQSGNDNDWQPVNLDHNDTVADSPTDNFATWNGVVAGNFTLSEGNLKSTVGTNRNGIVSSIGFDPQDTDGYKAEFTINTLGNMVIGLADETFKTDEGTVYATTQARAVVYGADGTVYDDGSSQGTFSSFTAGDVVTMYVKSGSLYYAVNGALANSGSAVVTGISDDKVFWLHALSGTSSGTLTANFGQQPFVHTTSLDS